MLNFKNVLVVAAMDVEHNALTQQPQAETVVLSERLGLTASRFRVGETNVNIVKSGVGGVNAGVTVAFALDRLDIDAVLMIGVGGALDEKLDVGDFVVASTVVQHDALISRTEDDGGTTLMSPGELFLTKTDDSLADPIISTNAEMHDAIYSAFDALGDRVFSGLLISGSEFVGTHARKHELTQRHPGALLVDMEACAVAQLCRKQGVAFVIAKTVADRMNPDGSVTVDYKTFLEAAAQRAGRILEILFGESTDGA
ncbi:MAG TPA: 5'-methylthioadenosine/S-adenosylhomocysteine nucleosidase [Bdellovibrionota bacterium]|nr:5'-methylthioadenosine/S-adenosylhomocysteine nucleosidase [Bdellovibrionota bacterium]